MIRLGKIIILSISLLMVSAAAGRIAQNCQGSGEPVYLIGGGPAFTTWNLGPIQQQLSRYYTVCRWDMRGVGENAAETLRNDIPVLDQWLQDMAAVFPQEPVVLWGHSWGALQAMLFARAYPERVRAMVLNNPVDPALISLEQIENKRYVHPYVESQLKLEDIGAKAEARHRFRSKIASYFMDAETGWAYSAQFDQDDTNNSLNVKIWQEYRQKPLRRQDLEKLSDKISRVIYCKYDVLMPESLVEYSAVLPPDRHYVIDNCAHFPWVESPQTYYEFLLRSIDQSFR